MDPQWHYTDPTTNRTRGYGQAVQHGHEYNGQNQQYHSPIEYSNVHDTYQNTQPSSNTVSLGSTPSATPLKQEYATDADVQMEDADPYNRAKYPSRPTHSHRSSTQYLSHEGSTAAQRYSPMNMLSPSIPHGSSPKQQARNHYNYPSQSPGSRQSPTRQNNFAASGYQDIPRESTPELLLPG